MKRHLTIAAALVLSIGLHLVLVYAGREPAPPAEASKVPDVMWSATIHFPE